MKQCEIVERAQLWQSGVRARLCLIDLGQMILAGASSFVKWVIISALHLWMTDVYPELTLVHDVW